MRRPALRTIRRIIAETPEIGERLQRSQNVRLKRNQERNTARNLTRNNLHKSERNRNERTHQRVSIDSISGKISITNAIAISVRPRIIIPVIPSPYRTSKTTIVPDIQRAITWKNMVHMPKPAAQEAVMIESILQGHVLNVHSDMVQQETVLNEQVSKPPINQEDPG